ncbi:MULTISPECIES: orotate phosphoribosyltransferase [Sphingobacterium]|jgi:orotate phosphoribosyltransferase|uniref:orotate phosphoribosyltransferase n=1 Tax=Sphingobacterium TaxID=28453 RepID=UPI0004E5FC03|nr:MULTISPECIES: orotate phosphoribosyltransferase [Sphingobacterium]CDS91832.1 Orotate phosphoribosyltransferase [Sphingobacterium sp. PM2-P1-29]SJN51814.1 Orotate phosphoribosyltransferase [Sphingobacterium faecium PCAi_F2.5]MQP28016.1 orotate phosphoribosyltransferase [Sphingobacterium faecium]PTX09544.1 orotate phosphoribosyltransferase [Sphingobacterium faecium]UXD70566.1 orotate phosphoribosyltransferase [Sphingobacterium faecium]
MNNLNEVEQKVAESLLQIKAIKLQPKNPFTWASGWKSPIYCDNRITLSYPAIRTYIRQKLSKLIQEEFGSVDMISGVATAGIPQGVLVAQDLGLPFSYVRSSAKDHGRQNMIEGEVVSGQRVVVVEDLVSTGKSSLVAVKALREAGCNVVGLVSIFTYGLDEATKNFADAKCTFHSLCDYNSLIQVAAENGFIFEEDVELLKDWRKNPSTWSPTV